MLRRYFSASALALVFGAVRVGAYEPTQGATGQKGGMAGTGGPQMPDLKTLGPEQRVTAIRHRGDVYEVTTADGAVEAFWEFNLRFKTDGSSLGPEPGRPVIVGTGPIGDRAVIIFGAPVEIGRFFVENG